MERIARVEQPHPGYACHLAMAEEVAVASGRCRRVVRRRRQNEPLRKIGVTPAVCRGRAGSGVFVFEGNRPEIQPQPRRHLANRGDPSPKITRNIATGVSAWKRLVAAVTEAQRTFSDRRPVEA